MSVYALDPIRKLGSSAADTTLLVIRDYIVDKNRGFRSNFIEALLDFEPSMLKSFVPILQEIIKDENQPEIIRNKAKEVLEALGEEK
jgi:hypothetical protein